MSDQAFLESLNHHVLSRQDLELLKEHLSKSVSVFSLTEEILLDIGIRSKESLTEIMKTVRVRHSQATGVQQLVRETSLPKYGVCCLTQDHSSQKPSPFTHYCFACDLMVCDECLTSKHVGHFPVESITRKTEPRLVQPLVDRLQSSSRATEGTLKMCGNALEKLERSVISLFSDVVALRDALIKSIHATCEETIARIRQETEATRASLLQKVELNLRFKKEVDSLLADIEAQRELNIRSLYHQRNDFARAVSKLAEGIDSVARIGPVFAPAMTVDEKAREGFLNSIPQIFFVYSYGESLLPKYDSDPVKSSIVVVGGQNDEYLRSCEIFHNDSNSWTILPDAQIPRGNAPSLGYAKGKIFICGGFDGAQPLTSGECLTLASQQWAPIAPMLLPRCNASGVFLADEARFLVTGGYTGVTRIAECEVYSAETDTWYSVASLPQPRSRHRMVLFRDRPLVLGGEGMLILNSCLEYLIVEDSWKPFPSFHQRRRDFGAAVLNHRIYIAGGFDGFPLSSIEVFDGARWNVISHSLTRGKYGHALVALGQKLVLLGGSTLDVEVCDPQQKEEEVPQEKDDFPAMLEGRNRIYLASISF